MTEKKIPGNEQTILVMGLFVESPQQFDRICKDLIPNQYTIRIYEIYNEIDWDKAGRPKMYYASNILDHDTFIKFLNRASYFSGKEVHDFKSEMTQYRDSEDAKKRIKEIRNYKAKKIFEGLGT